MVNKKPARGSLKARRPINGAELPRSVSEDELEFLRAMDEYQQRNHRSFPTWGEVLGVLRELGYVKPDRTSKEQAPESEWQTLCSSLLQERDRLQLDLAEVREENELLKKSLGHLLFKGEDTEIDKKALLEEFDRQPSFGELIAEIKGAGE